MEFFLIIVLCLILNNAHGFKNCNFVNNSIIASYESDGLNFSCEKSPNFTFCELFKENPSWDQRCAYKENDDYYLGQCHRLRHTGSETSCEYVLSSIRQNGSTFMFLHTQRLSLQNKMVALF